MDKKFDVGVVGVWYGCNYGSIATYYALHSMLTSMGKSVLMIDKPIMSSNDFEISHTHSRRFALQHYEISERRPLDKMSELNQYCDTFLLGSDQLWNYGISKGTKKTFYLDFVEDSKKKIAYATSFGHSLDFAPKDEREKISELMAKFDGISLREDDGVTICKNDYAIRAIQVLDPVFMVPPEAYQPLIDKSTKGCDEPYMVAYILDPSPEKKAALEYVSQKLGGLKIINLLDGVPNTFEKNRAATDMPNCIENLQVEDWLKYFSNARFVVTDSCHGVCFAMIFKKNFIGICNQRRGVSRFKSLSRQFNIGAHIVDNMDDITKKASLFEPVNYEKIYKILEEKREFSYQWLKNILMTPKKSIDELLLQNDIDYKKHHQKILCINDALDALQCSGCGACAACCPKDAITMKQDEWGYYRSVVNRDECIQCKKCLNVCPALKLPENKNTTSPQCFAFTSARDDILMRSSSGGVFAHLAFETFKRNGAVAGAAWKDDFSVENMFIYNQDDLPKLQKSKYLQSSTANTFRETKQLLESGKTVLYTGTPCQITGLRAYLGREYDNLICVDILCGNAPSTKFFQKYAEESFGNMLEHYEFRHKSPVHRWDSIHIEAELKNGKKILRSGPKEDAYQRVYHNHTMCSLHCENCRYQAFPRPGDLSIGDFWGISKHDSTIDTFKGVSIILCNNEKGKAFFESIPNEDARLKKQVPLEWMGGNGHSRKGGKNFISPYRDDFFKAILTMPFSKAVDYSFHPRSERFRGMYKGTSTPLRYDSNMLHFFFEKDVWEEQYVDGFTKLTVKNDKWKKLGHYARLYLAERLESGKKYHLRARLKIKSDSNILNLHIYENVTRNMKIIKSLSITNQNDGNHWINVDCAFRPDKDIYDEFMVGAAHLKGPDNFLIIDYIIIEAKESNKLKSFFRRFLKKK